MKNLYIFCQFQFISLKKVVFPRETPFPVLPLNLFNYEKSFIIFSNTISLLTSKSIGQRLLNYEKSFVNFTYLNHKFTTSIPLI
jgi:hypothetical protein